MSKELTVDIFAEIIKARAALNHGLQHFNYLELGGMAWADHRVETLEARDKAVRALKDLNYYERLAGVTETKQVIPESMRHYRTDGGSESSDPRSPSGEEQE